MTTILDGYSVNPGDLSWQPIEQATDALTVYDRTAPHEVVERAKDSEFVLTNKVRLGAETLRRLPSLRYIGVLATGTNVVDLDEAHRLGITVTNIPAYSTDSVAQMTFALLLAFTNSVEHYTALNRRGQWADCEDFCYWDHLVVELAGKQMGIVGFGNIGSSVARIARAFGMRVAVHTSKAQDALPEGVEKMDLDRLFATSDVVSLHCPLTPSTLHLVSEERLRSMKPTSLLVNTARGPLVDEEALARALREGWIAGAAVDVLAEEPPRADNPLLSAPRCMVTPHIAWASSEARRRLIDIAAANIRAFRAGRPINTV